MTPFLLRPSLPYASFIHYDIYQMYLPASFASKERERERSFACRFHTFSAAMSEGTRFSFVRLLWRKAVSPTLSSLPLSYIYPGGVRVSKGTRGRSCCNFISRMRPHAPAVCLSLFFSFLFSPSLSPLGTSGSTLRRSLANTFRRVSQAVLATCCCHGLVHKHLFLIKFR